MRILQVCPGYFPGIGGVEHHVRNLSERLARENKVTVFATDPSGSLPKEEEINGVLVRRFRSFSPNNAYHISLGMARELRKSKFDVVHGHNYHAFPLFFSRYAKRNKFIVTTHYHGHGSTVVRDFLIRFYQPFGKRVLREADRIIAVSSYERDLLMKDFKIDGAKIKVIPNGIDLADFKNLEKAATNHKTILYVGRLEGYKGVQYVIQALPFLSRDIRLEVVGDGPYKGSLIRLAKTLGVETRVAFYRDLPRDDLLNRYVNADLFVMLSKYESFGIVVAEALAAKTPCIVANTSALREWIDNDNCFGMDYPISSDELASLINRVMGKKIGHVKLWDWDEVAEKTLNLYQDH
jgi:glycosyltransferase involved in cell wall biosynthesis